MTLPAAPALGGLPRALPGVPSSPSVSLFGPTAVSDGIFLTAEIKNLRPARPSPPAETVERSRPLPLTPGLRARSPRGSVGRRHLKPWRTMSAVNRPSLLRGAGLG